MIGGLIVLVLLLVGIFADQLAQYGENEINLRARLQLPHAEHWLGTDNLGRDLYTRIVYGARVSLVIGLSATAVSLLVALVIGGLSGYIGGKTDLIVQRFVDAWVAFPGLLILITAMSMLGNGQLQIIIVVGITFGIGGSRIVRSTVIGLKENTYIEAARAIGTPFPRILLRHMLPNILPLLIVIYTLTLGGVILTEAALSFLGFGLLLMRFNVIHATQSKDGKWIHPIDAKPVPGATQATEDPRIAVALRTCDPETPIDWHRVAASHTPQKILDLVESNGLNVTAFRHNREHNFGTTLGDISHAYTK